MLHRKSGRVEPMERLEERADTVGVRVDSGSPRIKR